MRLLRAAYRTRTRYVSTASEPAATGTLNCAAQAAVFVHVWLDRSIVQSPPMGSLTSTLIGTALWLRSVISNWASQTYSPIRVK